MMKKVFFFNSAEYKQGGDGIAFAVGENLDRPLSSLAIRPNSRLVS